MITEWIANVVLKEAMISRPGQTEMQVDSSGRTNACTCVECDDLRSCWSRYLKPSLCITKLIRSI